MIIENNGVLTPVEIKSGTTYQEKWWKNIMNWNVFSKNSTSGVIVYGGNENHNFSDDRKVISYNSIVI